MVDLPEEDPLILSKMIDFVYLGDYEIDGVQTCSICKSSDTETIPVAGDLPKAIEALHIDEGKGKLAPKLYGGGDYEHRLHKALLYLELYICGDHLDMPRLTHNAANRFFDSISDDYLYRLKGSTQLAEYALKNTRADEFPLVMNLLARDAVPLLSEETKLLFARQCTNQWKLAQELAPKYTRLITAQQKQYERYKGLEIRSTRWQTN